MITLPMLATGALALLMTACPNIEQAERTEVPQLDHPNIECPAFQVVLMTNWDTATLPCNPDGNQILATTIDDDQADFDECDHSGGQILHDPAIDRFYCISLDY